MKLRRIPLRQYNQADFSTWEHTMNSEQIVRATIAAIEAHDLTEADRYIADDLQVSDPTLPRALSKAEFLGQMTILLQAFGDWKYDIQTLTADGDQIAVVLKLRATQTAPLALPGLPPLPANGKTVEVPDNLSLRSKRKKSRRS